ncbi:MAG: hypothetical protein ACI8W3_001345 [Myxococcota bacterium]|jgi:hypothetical protein
MTRITTFFVAAFVLSAAASASAGPPDERQHKQLQRIEKGIEKGTLGPREVRRLNRQQDRIAASIERMRGNDGKRGRFERAKLRHRQRRASRQIAFAKRSRVRR